MVVNAKIATPSWIASVVVYLPIPSPDVGVVQRRATPAVRS